ncbi:hypothetical protein VTL71DRAFT_5056 [Oculimacula yallundae]|uniref:Uncharacterized protein n=1 Tax=Oculimacula yallundae TaxID=86028 RepID=A0ABR4C012_9HELO
MVDSRPKRKSAAKAESENKRIAVLSRDPLEATDLLTQDDVVEKERPAPQRRSSVKAEASSKKTLERSPPVEQPSSGTPGSAQVQVVIQQPSSSKSNDTAPPSDQSNNISSQSKAQNTAPTGPIQQPVLARPRPSMPNIRATGSFIQQRPPPSNVTGPGVIRPNLQAPTQFRHSAGPYPGPSPTSKPTLTQQVMSMNHGTRHPPQQNADAAFSCPAAVYPQSTSSIDTHFDAASLVQRAVTKSSGGTTTSQALASHATAAQSMRKKISPEERERMLNVARQMSGQPLQHDPRFQTAGTSQLHPIQAQPSQHARPRTSSFPPGQPAGLANVSSPKPNQHSGVSPVQALVNTNRPAVNVEVPGHLVLKSNGPQNAPANFAVPSPHSHQASGAPNGSTSSLAPQSRAKNEVSMRSMPPPPNRRRSNSAGAALSTARVPVAPFPHFTLTPPSQPGHPNPMGGKPPFDSPRPFDVPGGNSGTRPRFKINFDPNTMARDQLLDDSDATVSPSPLKGSGPLTAYSVPPIPLFNKARTAPLLSSIEDSDATVSPSPLKGSVPQKSYSVPPVPLSAMAQPAPVGPVSPRTPSDTDVPNQAQMEAGSSPPITIAARLESLVEDSGEAMVVPSQHEYGPDSALMSDQEPLVRQRNIDFQYKPDPPYRAEHEGIRQQREETPAGFDQLLDGDNEEVVEDHGLGSSSVPVMLPGSNNDDFPLQHPHQEEEENEMPVQQQNDHLEKQLQIAMESLADRFKIRNDAMSSMPNRSPEDDEEVRLSSSFLKTLENLKIGRALDKSMASDKGVPAEDDSSCWMNSVPACLAVTLLPASTEVAIRSQPQPFHEMMAGNDDDGCVFCLYECSFGISDSRVWLPEEASIGYCAECHEETQEVFRLWEGEYKLPHGLHDKAKEKYKLLVEKQATTPLKELGDALDYKLQYKTEMSSAGRQDAINNASRLYVKDADKSRREQRKEIKTSSYVRNLARGGKLPLRRAVSGGETSRKDLAASVRRLSESLGSNAQQMGYPNGKERPGPSPLSTYTPTLPSSAQIQNQVTRTGWLNGTPSALPVVSAPDPRETMMSQAEPQSGSMTPNSAAFMGVLKLSVPPGTNVSNSATPSGSGTTKGSATTFPPPPLSNNNTPASHDTSSRPPSTSAQPTGPSGIPRYFSAAPSSSFLNLPPRPSNTGPSFCRSCPWRQIDFTKAKICTACRDCKFLICSHKHHTSFRPLVDMPGVFDGKSLVHGVGRVGPDGKFIADGRYSNCMVCTGTATHRCFGCPLRLCGECVTKLTMMSKGKIGELLNCFNMQREHIRNDAFLLRSDNKGY